MWVGTYGGGLNRFDPKDGEFTVYRHDAADNTTLSSDRILDIFRDRAGGLWVSTFGGGLNLRDPDTGEVLDESMTEFARLTVSQVKEKLSICTSSPLL